MTDSDRDGYLDAAETETAAVGARAEDEKVEDLSQRTESVSVFANPDGTFTRRDFGATVRVKKSGKWTPIDYTLVKQSDGSYAPKASDIDITIAGGAREAARVDLDGDESLAFTWPKDLPEPSVDGGVATYKLSKATDLVVAVTANGVAARIRLNEKPAADDPVFTLGLRADSLDLTQQQSTGALTVTNDEDKTVGGAQQLLAWDSQTDRAGDPTNIVELDATLKQTSTAGDVTNHALELTAPDGFLSAADTKYPVTIDPPIRVGQVRDTWVRSGQNKAYGDDHRLIVGKVDPDTSDNTNPARAYLKFFDNRVDTNPNVVVTNATLSLWQYYGYSCTDRRMLAYPVGAPWSDNLTWASGLPAMKWTNGTHVDDNRGASNCGQGWTKLNLTSMAQAWNTGAIDNNGLRLQADDETVSAFERRFCSMDYLSSELICNTSKRAPVLETTYNTFPSTAGTPSATNREGKTVLTSKVSDPDGGTVRAHFVVSKGTTTVFDGYSAYVPANTTATVTVPKIPEGSYSVRTWSSDGSLESKASSAATAFSVEDVSNSSVTAPSVITRGSTTAVRATLVDPEDERTRMRASVTDADSKVVHDSYSSFVESGDTVDISVPRLAHGTYTLKLAANNGRLDSATRFTKSFTVNVLTTDIAGSSPAALSIEAAVAQQNAASTGPETIWVAPATNDLALAQANANAAALGGVAVADGGELSVAALKGRLQAARVALVGPAEQFSGPFLDWVSSPQGLPIAYDLRSSRPERWSPGLFDEPTSRFVAVGRAEDARSVALAVTSAITKKGALLLLDKDAPAADIRTALTIPTLESAQVFNAMDLVPTTELSAEEAALIQNVATDDREEAALSVVTAHEQIAAGRSSLSLVVAPSVSEIGTYAAAVAVANRLRAVAMPEDAAREYISSLSSPLSAVRSLSLNPESKTAHELASIQDSPPADPIIRATNLTLDETGDTFTVSITPVPGAVKYAAFDVNAARVGESTSTSIQVPGVPRPLAVGAFDSSGAVLTTLQVRANEFSAADQRREVILGSTSDSRSHLRFLGPAGIPRLVTRTRAVEVDGAENDVTYADPDLPASGEMPEPAADGPPEELPADDSDLQDPTAGDEDESDDAADDGSPVTVLTCASTFTDVPLPRSVEYEYTVKTLTTNPSGCGGPDAGTTEDEPSQFESGVRFPANAVPVSSTSRTSGSQAASLASAQINAESPELAADISIMGAMVRAETDKANSETAARGNGTAGHTGVNFRYQTFIRQRMVYAPGLPRSLSRPIQGFAGDHRGFGLPNGPFRTQQNVRFRVGKNPAFFYSERVGVTRRYKCGYKLVRNGLAVKPKITNCDFEKKAYADMSKSYPRSWDTWSVGGMVNLVLNAKDPLIEFGVGPAIDARLRIGVDPYNVSLKGQHDRMPDHEMFARPDGSSKWKLLYKSPKGSIQCLFGKRAPGKCTVRVNKTY
ncbi:DNRLRE domain-containing protein [Aeromicrobium massiliense]|uniref:DNRLRE domain-containing protein n=1 Tax=Aeromicrobium massiliense TaxID=1464554 RepID=UPI00057616D8|nr:DNRLRE domain-containing protein [Aeromicrobium massiliense]